MFWGESRIKFFSKNNLNNFAKYLFFFQKILFRLKTLLRIIVEWTLTLFVLKLPMAQWILKILISPNVHKPDIFRCKQNIYNWLKLAKQELKLYSQVMRYANQDQSYPFFRGLDWKACYNDLFSKKSQEMSRKSKEHRTFL